MKMTVRLAVAAGVLLTGGIGVRAASAPASLTSIPEYINYQGRLVDPAGVPYSNVNHVIQLRLYDNASGGIKLWAEQYTVKTQDGYFSLLLGSGGSPLDGLTNKLWKVLWRVDGSSPDTFFLGITVATDKGGAALGSPVEATPRQQFLTSPFAYRSHQSIFASKAADAFEAPAGINTPTITSTQDVTVTDSVRITGVGNGLYANSVQPLDGVSDLKVSAQSGRSIQITPNSGPLYLGYASSPSVMASSVTLGYYSGAAGTLTYIYGNSIGIYAGNNGPVTVQSGGDVRIGYTPPVGIFPATYASNTIIGANNAVDFKSDTINQNGLPLFAYRKVLFAGTAVSAVETSISGLTTTDYDLMVVGADINQAFSSVYITSLGKVRVEFPSAVNSLGYVMVLGIRKGLTSGFTY